MYEGLLPALLVRWWVLVEAAAAEINNTLRCASAPLTVQKGSQLHADMNGTESLVSGWKGSAATNEGRCESS